MNSRFEDILREIFKSCLDTCFPHVQPFSPAEAPLLLCGVCAWWRTIALTTPELWARLSVSIGREGSDKAQQPSQQLIKTWIARSGARPLTLVLKDLGLRSDMAEDVLQILLPHIHRWQSITFLLPNYPFPSALMDVERLFGGASQLQIANLEFGDDPAFQAADTPQVAGLARLLSASSQLHTLYYRNDLCTLRFLDISWAHLTVIDLVPMWSPMSQIIEIMQKAPKLRSLSVFIEDACKVVRPLLLPDLVILWIGSKVEIGPLFKQLTLPALSNINVFCGNLVPPVPQTDVVDCVARSGCSLRIAIFKSLGISKADLITFLRLSPTLLLFEVSNDGAATITDDIVGLLTAGNTSCLCPHLRIIRFLESSVSSADGLLADMVASRRTKGSPASLSRLVVDFSDADLPRHAADIRRLRGLEEAPSFRVWINQPETE
ncbi:hypothetical protein C8F04DRAFT_1393245 [Mycena alexandri]|uniref:F-box domain-containing protein n=1 Tax=Mycena alexandri TaxID=1745969 RepID=A0AAD6T201_9AGAR|nr:hypothetical protein C8F04DRAFT_1393245 [Mycena alexandri]